MIVYSFARHKKKSRKSFQILRDYGKVSGQQINFAKSSLPFGHKIDEIFRPEMKYILNIRNIGDMGLYLSIPKRLRGLETHILDSYRRVCTAE